MFVARILLLGTLCLLSTSVVTAEDSVRTNAFERFRPATTSASGPGQSASHFPRPALRSSQAKVPTTYHQTFAAKPTLPTDTEALTTIESRSEPTTRPAAKLATKPISNAPPAVDPLIAKLANALNEPTQTVQAKPPAANQAPTTQTLPSVPMQQRVAFEETPPIPQETEAPKKPKNQKRKLGFSSSSIASTSPKKERPKSAFNELMAWRPSTGSLATTGAALSIVIGLITICAWVAKKSMPKSARVLPNEIAEVLGRVVLSSRQTAQLIKLGNKLLLVSVTSDGAETLAEITDPAEVQRILQLSEESNGNGSNAEFEKIFNQLTTGPAADGFLGDEAPSFDDPRYQDPDSVHYDAARIAAAYANTPGGRSHAA